MTPYKSMSREELLHEKKLLNARYEQFKDQKLKLNMARGIPGKDQLELSMAITSPVT